MAESGAGQHEGVARFASRVAVPAAVVAIALVFCLWFIPHQLLDPASVDWVFGTARPIRDDAGHAIQAMAFGQEPWSWPPGKLNNFGGPVGASMIYAAVSPILAFPAKVLESVGVIGQFWQFIGVQALLGLCLTSLAVYFLGRALGASKVASGTVAILALTLPELLRYVPNESLTWQFLAIVPMILLLNDKRADRPYWPWLLLAALAVWSNTYLLVPVVAFFIAHLWTIRRRYRTGWPKIAREGLILIATIVILTYLGGGFLVPLTGLGTSSTDVSLLGSNVFGFLDARGFGLPTQFADAESPQSFNYLGIAILVLLVAGGLLWIVRRIRQPRAIPGTATNSLATNQSVPPLLIPTAVVAGMLFVLSLGPTIRIGTFLTITVPLPAGAIQALSTFRAVGRFSWPLMYLLVGLTALAIDSLVRTVPGGFPARRYVPSAVCLAVVVLQFGFMGSFLTYMRSITTTSVEQVSEPNPRLDAAVANSREIEFVPAYDGDADGAPFRPLSYYSIKYKVPMTTFHWLGRYDQVKAGRIQAEGAARATACKWTADRIYAVSKAFLPRTAGCRYQADLLWSNDTWVVLKLRPVGAR